MIRSFADKVRDKAKIYEAEQKLLAEKTEKLRIQKENEKWEVERLAEQEQVDAILQEEAYRKEQKYLQEKAKQDTITRRRIEEWEAAEEDRLAKFELSKKIITEGHISATERYIAQSKQKSKVKKKRGINEGMPINAASTWQLTWKTFSQHPDIINLPMSEKVRLYKLAERKQADKLNYYATMGSVAGSGLDFEDGTIDHDNTIHVDTIINSSLDVNGTLKIVAGITVTVNGILTVNNSIINDGTLIINGLVIKQENITNNGTLIIN